MMPRFLISIVALIFAGTASSQEATVDRFSLSTEVFQLGFRNLQLRGLQRTGRWDYGLHIGYRPRFGDRTTITEATGFFSGYAIAYHMNGIYQALTTGPILRYRTGKDRRGWFELELMYRYWWYDEQYVVFDGWRTQFEGVRTEVQHVYAWKFLLGGTIATGLHTGPRTRMIVEIFGGIGSRQKEIRWTMHEGTLNGSAVAGKVGRESMHLPSFHWGCRIGLDRAVRIRDTRAMD
jgi:hypothetical protein